MTETAAADAPGRVNLIGEHTDYHEGFVLPTVIPQRTIVTLERRSDRVVRVKSARLSTEWAQFEVGHEAPGRGWLDYVQGVTAILRHRGVEVPGVEVRIDSMVPLGAGVSSSAALQVSLLRALRTLLALEIDDLEVARIAQAAETTFVGAPVGIMDQMASSLGRDREALLIDTRTLIIERLPLPDSIELAVIDSGITHQHASGEYATRRRESFEAAALLGVGFLRDLKSDALPRIDALPPLLARRARHVVTENVRVVAAAAALRIGDVRTLGALFAASHLSMRDDYEISTPEIDTLVKIARQHPAIGGARMTGGGFGGAVVLIATAGAGRSAAHDICSSYQQQTGCAGAVIVPPS